MSPPGHPASVHPPFLGHPPPYSQNKMANTEDRKDSCRTASTHLPMEGTEQPNKYGSNNMGYNVDPVRVLVEIFRELQHQGGAHCQSTRHSGATADTHLYVGTSSTSPPDNQLTSNPHHMVGFQHRNQGTGHCNPPVPHRPQPQTFAGDITEETSPLSLVGLAQSSL